MVVEVLVVDDGYFGGGRSEFGGGQRQEGKVPKRKFRVSLELETKLNIMFQDVVATRKIIFVPSYGVNSTNLDSNGESYESLWHEVEVTDSFCKIEVDHLAPSSKKTHAHENTCDKQKVNMRKTHNASTQLLELLKDDLHSIIVATSRGIP
ncbi:hypothetical protein ACFE04_015884 [Oxalis oulophora]